VLEDLKALVKLAKIDILARDLEEELKNAPRRLEELQNDVNRLEELLKAEQQQLEEATSLYQAQDEGIKEQTQALARSKAKSAKARTMREADAVEKEMEVIRRMLKERESEREKLKEAIDKRGTILEQHKKEFEQLVAIVSEEEKTTRKRLAELEAQRADVLSGRDEQLSKITTGLIKRYDRVRSKRGGIGVVSISGDCCGGCHMVLPPQQVNAVHKAETLEQCPRCQRFMYDLELFNREEDPPTEL
jgi:predicted  nucleic acid-binding Zn-ribbon protein